MSETEKLLAEAQRLARVAFDSPAQETVMGLFVALCAEQERVALFDLHADRATVH